MQRDTGKTGRRMNRRAFGAAGRSAPAPRTVAAGGRLRGAGGRAAARLRAGLAGRAAAAAADLRPAHRGWQDHFSSIAQDAILVNVNDRVLHYWGSDGFYRIYPTSVPLTEEMTRRGRTTSRSSAPTRTGARPTAMLQRRPDLPTYVPPGPDNPLGIRALNLGWPAYRIHGTNDIRKIGRQSSSRLHRALQRAHPRGLRPRPDRNAGVANLTTPVIYWAAPLSPIE